MQKFFPEAPEDTNTRAVASVTANHSEAPAEQPSWALSFLLLLCLMPVAKAQSTQTPEPSDGTDFRLILFTLGGILLLYVVTHGACVLAGRLKCCERDLEKQSDKRTTTEAKLLQLKVHPAKQLDYWVM